MRKLVYNAVFAKSQDGFGVDFPDLPGCISFGATLQDAENMAREALSLHIFGMERDKDALPVPSDPPYDDMDASMFVVPITIFPDLYRRQRESKAVRANISMPAWMKEAADTAGLNVSQIAQEAVMEQLIARGLNSPAAKQN